MRRVYNKLVRDGIPEYLDQRGDTCAWEMMKEEEYQGALRAKLVEEAREASEAESARLVKELADLYEVIDALMATYDIEPEQVRAEQQRKRAERGGFGGRVRLLWAETP